MKNNILLDQSTFYAAFLRDLERSKQQVVIESPFLTRRRVEALLPTLQILRRRGVNIIINTKPLHEHTIELYEQAARSVDMLQEIGVKVLMTVGHHRKVAIIDGRISYTGSLNIFSQNDSCEIMHRIDDASFANHLLGFINLKRWCK